MKVTAFIGTATKKHTCYAVERFLQNLQSMGDVDCEIVRLSECDIGICQGCKLCLDRGEELCRFRDDRDMLIEKLERSDGVVFASPNYSFNVSGIMKVFLDRLAFLFHRPRFFGKTFTGIVVEGIYGGKEIVKYFDFIGNGFGFNVVSGVCVRSLEPMGEKDKMNFDAAIDRLSKKFYLQLVKKEFPVPSLFRVMIFRWARSGIKRMLNEDFKDYRYYRDKGWFESDYYYPVKLNPFKKLAGRFFDWMGSRKGL
ncbi:MAG TPA: flavodoxin family protein [Spirochaetota bacterium]|nr:flavodoxin family protein [Spirochaetota bacterium]HPI88936.1 flavodoxin family protein [Spirochaetota bacterium]HPR46587.1 flavodoxin family protein [Spirochaetota bacterium]